MLSQRLAKQALLAALTGMAVEDGAAAELIDGFGYLQSLPLSNPAITAELARATACWDATRLALPHAGSPAGQERIARLSEDLLRHFDALTDQLERGMQALVR